jgi:AcrR family transcriptional regulator
MNARRGYSMELRAAATEATRERVLDAAAAAFLERWYDDVTIAEVARRAGVSGQTVINHFGGKEELATAAYERLSEQIVLRRYTPEAGDHEGAIQALADDYEITGDALSPLLQRGRAGHREWVEAMFGAPELVPELVVATDVYTWKLLRRDQGLSRDETAAAILRIVEALLERRSR